MSHCLTVGLRDVEARPLPNSETASMQHQRLVSLTPNVPRDPRLAFGRRSEARPGRLRPLKARVAEAAEGPGTESR